MPGRGRCLCGNRQWFCDPERAVPSTTSLQIAASLTLQPPARLDSVEIAEDVKLEHRRRMISPPAGRCRGDAIEPQLAQFQRIDEHIDRPNRIALVHPIIRAFPLAIRPLNETLHHPPA